MTDDVLFCDFPLVVPPSPPLRPVAVSATPDLAALLARLEATSIALRRGEDFRQRVRDAGDDLLALADLMAEAVDWASDAAPHDQEARNQGITISMAETEAAYCLAAVRAAYGAARLAAQAAGSAHHAASP